MSVVENVKRGHRRFGINCHCKTALPAYITSVAAVEAFINEEFLGKPAHSIYHDSPLWDLDEEWVEKLELKRKLILVPSLLFGKPFPRSKAIFNDISQLISIRNDITHYKMYRPVGKYMKDLYARRITWGSTRTEYYWPNQPWVNQLNCTEGIRWAYNTACLTLHTLLDLQGMRQEIGFYSKDAFPLITEKDVNQLFESLTVDTTTDTPLYQATEHKDGEESNSQQ